MVRRGFTWQGRAYQSGDVPPDSLLKARQGKVFMEHGRIIEAHPPESYICMVPFLAEGREYQKGDRVLLNELSLRTVKALSSTRKIIEEPEEREYTCEKCGRVFDSPQGLGGHRKSCKAR